MKYGIFSDIHGNLEAFEVVLEALKKETVDGYVFLGDIVGYGANPKECLHLLKDLVDKRGCFCVAGNHDYAVCKKTETEHFVRYAKDAVDWTRGQLDELDIEFLKQMDLVHREGTFTAVHANLETPDSWGYIFDIDDANPNFKLLANQICFIGHSHKPIVFTSGKTVDWSVADKIHLQPDAKYIINVGSVGQPRDGNPKASFAIYDSGTAVVEIRRLEYDVQKAQKKIIEAGLPGLLAERLALGK